MNNFEKMRLKESRIPAADLIEWFSYCESTGSLLWKKCSNNAFLGKEAGNVRTDRWGKSYRIVIFMGLNFMCHRIAWAIKHSEWPSDQIDHRNRDGLDNRIENLRVVTNAINARNTRRKNKASSGHRGVRWHTIGKKWNARIKINGKDISLGLYVNIEDAIAARRSADIKHGFSND